MYRVTFETGITGVVDDDVERSLIRQARERGRGLTPVRCGWVVTLPSGAMVAVLREGSVNRFTEVAREGLWRTP